MTAAPDFTPFLATPPRLLGAARPVLADAARLGAGLHPHTLTAAAELLRTVNCYYSNLIEGHDTNPAAIEQAMRGNYDAEPAKRTLQLEAQAHIAVQEIAHRQLDAEPGMNVTSGAFLRQLHRDFFERVPEEMRVVRTEGGTRTEQIVPGAFRHYDVQIGPHVAPPSAEVAGLMSTFEQQYDSSRFRVPGGASGAGLLAVAAAHHRFLWIHPFGDGNGRVVRLMTDAYLREIGAGGHGLWTVSRGLARRREDYAARLADADAPRWNAYEARGALSLPGLERWCAFFIDVCADQVDFMGGLLDVTTLADRAEEYGEGRERGRIAVDSTRIHVESRRGRPSRGAPKGTAAVLRALIIEGELTAPDVARIASVSTATSYRIMDALREGGFVEREGFDAPLRVRFPAHALPYLFPALAPTTPSA